jgi:hypothetical protein
MIRTIGAKVVGKVWNGRDSSPWWLVEWSLVELW